MTQTPTPMNAVHKEADVAILKSYIKAYIRPKVAAMLKTLDEPSFDAGYTADPGTPVADQVIAFEKDIRLVLLAGRNYLRNNMTSPQASDGAFKYLEDQGVFATLRQDGVLPPLPAALGGTITGS